MIPDSLLDICMFSAGLIGFAAGVCWNVAARHGLMEALRRERVGRERERLTFNRAYRDMVGQRDEALAHVRDLAVKLARSEGHPCVRRVPESAEVTAYKQGRQA